VIDTNVFISSLLSTKGKPRRLIDLWRFEKITLCVSKEILAEYFMVLGRFGLAMEPEVKKLMRLFQTRYNLVYIGSALSVSAYIPHPEMRLFAILRTSCNSSLAFDVVD
jgi:putative PIN family toxin of toxin-antitoxin system